MLTQPSLYRPASFADLIGPAAQLGRVMAGKIARIKGDPRSTFKGLFYGPPGVGKTELAKLTADLLAGDKLAIEEISGLQVNIDLVKHWIHSAGMGGLFGDWQVKVIHEMDRIPTAAQDLLLQYLDALPGKTGFIGTSNLQLDLLQERFQTRMQTWKVLGPDGGADPRLHSRAVENPGRDRPANRLCQRWLRPRRPARRGKPARHAVRRRRLKRGTRAAKQTLPIQCHPIT